MGSEALGEEDEVDVGLGPFDLHAGRGRKQRSSANESAGFMGEG
jgi:hypothetical protein